MSEYSFTYRQSVPAGRVVFQVSNVGVLEHELQLFPLTDDIPPIHEQLTGTVRRVLNPIAGVPRRVPGTDGVFSVELKPGQRYALVCFLTTAGTSHATAGMNSEFRALAS